jgi:hypothetical protein
MDIFLSAKFASLQALLYARNILTTELAEIIQQISKIREKARICR